MQAVPPFAFEQAVPQAPQFDVVVSDISQPSEARPLQLPKPEVQVTEQVPVLHAAVPFVPLHTVPHVPQLVRLVFVLVSQPLFLLLSQSLKVPLQTGVQMPEAQLVVPLAFVHAMPQPPQLFASAVVAVSQPFFGLPSQSAYPAVHAGTQTLAVQTVVPCALLHAWPHAPQLVTLVARFASHPFTGLPSQLPNPPLQVGTQVPAVHVVVPLTLWHAVPQAPQLETFVFRFASHPFPPAFPSQLPKPAEHAIAQAPSEQLALPFAPLHTVPQPPQFVALVSVAVSHPFGLFESQLPQPEVQAPRVQALDTQEAPAWAKLHTLPQDPQFDALFVRFVSQPLPALPSQLPRPALHEETPQTPPTQFGVPPVAGQMFPHVLQLFTSVFVLVSQPLFGLPSQSLNPAEHVGTQAPAVHVVEPFVFVHALPQMPQFVVVVRDASQPFRALPSQLPKFALHVGTHAPTVQTVEPFAFVHASPHPPQFGTDVCVFVSQPLFAFESQSPKPELHVGRHTPLGHVVVPFVFEHPVPHPPQFVVVVSGASQPLPRFASQLPNPAPHAIAHAPSAQLAVPLLLLHTVPHVPQFEGFVCVLISHPFVETPSQLPKPAVQVPSVHVPAPQDSLAFA